MLEGLATWVLNNYLGKYLENLNTDQLSIGLLKGEVELENVPLRKDALRHLDMPIEVKSGFVGKVKLHIPVSRLRSEPWVIMFEQLYLVAGPVKLDEYDEEAEEAASHGRKIAQLDGLEAAWRADQEALGEASHYASSYFSWLSYGTSFMTNIIENIQLKIHDVHLRYEDDQSIAGQIFAFGLTVDSLSLQSSDDHWIPRFVYGGSCNMAYKLLELNNMGIYWDTNAEIYSMMSMGDMAAYMSAAIAKRDHDFILLPVSATACVKRNLNEAPLRSRSSPRITCDLKLDEFPLSLSDSQYRQALKWNKEYDRLDKVRHHRKWRPSCRVQQNTYDWWQYAIQSHLDKIHKRYVGRNWAFAQQRANDIVKYVNIYSDYLRNPATVPTECKAHKLKLEQELNFSELRYLREVAMERVSKELTLLQKEKPPSANTSVFLEEPPASPTQSGEGILQRWFPAWGGWYSSSTTTSPTTPPGGELEFDSSEDIFVPEVQGQERKEEPEKQLSGSLEEEILYVLSDSMENNTFMKRDAVFCQLSFSLKRGSFSLTSCKIPSPGSAVEEKDKRTELFELEFANVKLALESRPRNKSYKVDIELGSLNLRDKVTQDSAFPLLISPQNSESSASGLKAAMSRTSTMYARLTTMISPSQPKMEGPLFSLTYECRPFNSKADHKLIVNSSALDIVYNPSALEAISNFFTTPYNKREGISNSAQMTALTTAARRRYEELKEQTKQELKRNWDHIIDGDLLMRKRWDIRLDISAPQIIIPEHFRDRNATLVVLDFGKLIFSSARPMSHTKLKDELDMGSDEEDEFATPCSTPDELETVNLEGIKEDSEVKSLYSESQPEISESSLHDRMYDKYDLRLCDMQVLVGKVRDNWRFAYLKGTGHLHVLDRFSINLQLERRVVMMPDVQQQWPSATIAGTLPKLVVHVNEQKIQALRTMAAQFSGERQQKSYGRMDSGDSVDSNSTATQPSTVMAEDETISEEEETSKGSSSPTDEGKLLVVQFTVDKMSLELQSRGRCIAELQVTGVRANLSKRPFDSTATLSVHSLLLVDALQTFGPDFELLVASHKHVSMDSVSGSLLDSEPCSPTSPASPDHNGPFKPTSPLTISHAISSYAASRAQSPPQSSRNLPSPPPISSPFSGMGGAVPITDIKDIRDSEALITLEITYVSPQCPSQQGAGALLLASVQFNTIDVIANQETVVELVGFVHQLFPHQPSVSTPRIPPHLAAAAAATGFAASSATVTPDKEDLGTLSHATSLYYVAPEKSPIRAEVSFDFHKLTVLLLRGFYKDKDLVGRKVGTAVMSDAKIQATVEKDILTVEGSLGGFQVRDVTPEGNKHQCIISVGQDPIVERSQDLFSRLNSDLYRSYSNAENAARAFSFTIIRPLAFSSSNYHDPQMLDDENLTVKLRLASVCYTHSPHFLLELKSCATEFKQYMTRVASSIKHAATEMAMGLVSKRIESFASLTSNSWEASPRHRRRMSVSKSTDTLNLPAPPPASASGSRFSPAHEDSTDLPFSLSIDIILETPVIVLPESQNSPDVLVAHLGQISIANVIPKKDTVSEGFSSFPPSKVAEYSIVVRDMSLFSLNVEDRLKSKDSTFQWFHPLSTTIMGAEELYSCQDHGRPILHSTTVELHIKHDQAAFLLADHESGLFFPSDIFIDLHPTASRDSLQIEGGIVTPLKIGVSRPQYRQFVKTLSNLSITPVLQNQDHQGLSSVIEEDPAVLETEEKWQHRESISSSMERESTTIAVKGSFSVPSMCVELRGDVGDKEKPLVNLLLEELKATYESCEPYKTSTQVTLRSLMMEDLQHGSVDSQHRYLMRSEIMPQDVQGDGHGQYGRSHPHSHISFLPDSHIPDFISTSCPEFVQLHPVSLFSSSLPDKLKMEKPFFKALQKPVVPPKKHARGLSSNQSTLTRSKGGVPCTKSPSTPPPSPTPGEEERSSQRPDATLVNITMTTIDKRCPEFHSKYDGTNRFIDVDFNSLITVINISSWVMVLDFFSTDQEDVSLNKAFGDITPDASQVAPFAGAEEVNTIMEIQVRSLTLIFNKPETELARASISQVLVRSVGSEGNLTLSGRLGSLSLIDCTSHGHLYPEKFLTAGTEAMTFQIFRYGHEDPDMQRECDIRMKLKMSSVMYIHTQRFAMELTQFVQQFNQLRDIVSRWRATSAGRKLSDFSRGSRVSLDISAGSPVIFLPMSSLSETLLVADLGSLTITNKFLWASSEGTISQVRRQNLEERLMCPSGQRGSVARSHSRSIDSRSRSRSRHRDVGLNYLSDSDVESDLKSPISSSTYQSHKCLLDVLYLTLVNMDLYTSTRFEHGKLKSGKYGRRHTEEEHCKMPGNYKHKIPEKAKKCSETKGIEEWAFGAYSVVRQGKSLLRDKCALNLQVERNLDTEISHSVPDISIHGTLSKVHATIHTSDYKLIRGLLMFNLGEPLPPPPPPVYLNQPQPSQIWVSRDSVWTSLNIILNLDNVAVELENLCEDRTDKTKACTPLACVNFIKSRLTFESFSDESKDVDLVSQEILLSDTRFEAFPVNKRSNIFTNILQPTPSKSFKNNSQLQAEVHYRSTKDVTRFTILLNNMRLMGILDWWMEVLDFIYKRPDEPLPVAKDTTSSIGTPSWEGFVTSPFIFTPCHTPASPQHQSPATQSPRSQSPLGFTKERVLRSNTPRLNPMVESTGVMTKHDIIHEAHKIPFELKLNITDSELVVVENTAIWDTSAVILKSTAVISYRPQHQERPLSCNLNQCELYSCILGLEDDTALSIIDPVTINLEVHDKMGQNQPVDISNVSMPIQHTVEVILHQLNIRLSYHDMKMFQHIFESLPKQREVAKKSSIIDKSQPANFQAQVEKLSVLGFHTSDCTLALEECEGRLDDAALWLTHNAQPVPAPTLKLQDPGTAGTINFHTVEIKTGGVNICIIDDCGDCDVPLLEISLSHLGLKQEYLGKGSAGCSLSVDYYNRALSGWEPFLEPWRCQAEWDKGPSRDLSGDRLTFSVNSEDTVNINITSTLLELYQLVKSNWTSDYYNRDRLDGESSMVSGEEGLKAMVVSPQGYRRRSPFIPFALKNDTGCDLTFATLTATPDSMADVESLTLNKMPEMEWLNVTAGNTIPFSFEGRGKQRHWDTHELKVHQLLVQVDGWKPVGPVSVDKVGVFFRLAPSLPSTTSNLGYELPSARIVVAVTLDGSARKLITIRSALILSNQLQCPVDVKLENVALRLGDIRSLQVAPKTTVAIPLLYVWARLFIKPLSPIGGGWLYCKEPLHWLTLLQPREEASDLRECPVINSQVPPFRFCVQVKRDNFPVDCSYPSPSNSPVLPARHNEWVQPGHSIVLVSPLTLLNLLPYDLHYEVRTTGNQGRVKPGEDSSLHSIDPAQSVSFSFWTDALTSCGEITLNPTSSVYVLPLKLQDSKKRVLYVYLRVKPQFGGALKVIVFCGHWLINKTGLPLVFKQEGVSADAAGQDREHEVARCAAPLMFSFTDRDASPMLVARVGSNLHPQSRAQYCHKLPLTQGTWVRRLRVSPFDSRPDHVYVVGVDVRPGRGRYRDTYMVTFSPRFQIENRSSHELIIAQKCFSTSFTDPSAQSTWLRAIPGCWLPFHWPRIDKDQLLCICLRDVPGCHWSGGFQIEKIDSFYLNIRDNCGHCIFLRLEIIINDATYFIVFTDAENLPPPFRIDNFSEVPITFYQTGTQEERLRTIVKPRSCVAYAWDDVLLPHHLTCIAPGGTLATYNMDVLGEGARITYENFIYIAFTGTFSKSTGRSDSENADDVTFDPTSVECQQLVLDVPEGTRVKLARKEIGRRSQLWRMTSTGMLQHEGSSPPHDPSSKKSRKISNILKKSTNVSKSSHSKSESSKRIPFSWKKMMKNSQNHMVLDIAGPAPQPTEYTPLMLRKPDERRRLTQTWRFTEDGRLCCTHVNMFVQAKDGFLGLATGNDVVLGPPQLVQYGTMPNGVPLEQAISRQRLRPGSGVLAVKVDTDGPTRVLQITDVHSKNTKYMARTESGDWVHITDEGGTTTIKKTSAGSQLLNNVGTLHEIEIQLKIKGGIGLSVIQRSPPEELIYAKLMDIVFEYQSSIHSRTVSFTIRDIQVDNQLLTAHCPVVLYITPQSKSDDTRYLPTVYFFSHQLRSSCTNAYIFKNLMVSLKNLTLTIEEALLFKIFLMAGYDQSDSELEKVEEHQYDMRRMLAAATSVNATRYYFSNLELKLNQVRLSVLTTKKLSPDLKNIKRKMGLSLVRFEHANVTLEPFIRCHPFETSRFLFDCITKHYKEELQSQAMVILGSTDFLGNPFGFFADVSEGVSELVHEGSVRGLMWNVTHGMANSAAKVTGSLSDVVGQVTMDDRHEELRQRIRTHLTSSGADHMVAGLRGLGFGLYGGLTSIISQTYKGASEEGVHGFFSGFAKGMIGTVTKPAIGFLDLASSTSLAVRDTSKNPSQKMPLRTRKPRLVIGLNGMMPRYSANQANGQELLLSFDHSGAEIFLGYDVLREGEENLKILISSQQVRVFSQSEASLPPVTVLRVWYRDLHQCRPLVLEVEGSHDRKHYIELTLKGDKIEIPGISRPSELAYKRPKVRCDTQEIAWRVAQQISYARNLHEELRQTLISEEEDSLDD